MGKYSLILVASLVLFSGCGSTDKNTTLGTSSTTQTYVKKQSVQSIKNQLGPRFQSFTYTKNKEGAFVYVQQDDSHHAIYLYGLEDPLRPSVKKIIRIYDEHYHFHGIKALDDDKVELIEQNGNSLKFKVIYNYINNSEIYNDFHDLANNPNNAIKSIEQQLKDIIKIEYRSGLSYTSHVVSAETNKAVALAFKDMGTWSDKLYLFDITDNIVTREKSLQIKDRYISNLKMLSDGQISYEANGETVIYNYINDTQVSANKENVL